MGASRTGLLLACAFSAAVGATPAQAEETAFGHIVSMQTGSVGGAPAIQGITTHIPADDTVSVTLDVPFVNTEDVPVASRVGTPGTPCKNTQGGYALDPKDTGVKLNESVLLSAFMAGRKVRLTVSGCVFNKPRIISVMLNTSAS